MKGDDLSIVCQPGKGKKKKEEDEAGDAPEAGGDAPASEGDQGPGDKEPEIVR